MSLRHLLFAAVVAASGCTDAPASAPADSSAPNQDAQPGGLFHDFFEDGKFDAAGHPQGAEVFEGIERCAPTTGAEGKFGLVASAGPDPEGVLCGAETRSLGAGTFALNVRAQLLSQPKGPNADVLEIRVLQDESELARRMVTVADFGEAAVEQDLALRFRHYGDGAVTFEVRWVGTATVQLRYVEIFRSTPRLVITPASRVLGADSATFEVEMQDPPDGLGFRVSCGDTDRTGALDTLLASGEAERVDTEFRAVLRAPTAALLDGCPLPSAVRVDAIVNGWATETSRVTYYGDVIGCAFPEDASPTRVLLTGFEPFPADSDRDNSSREAVEAYAAGPIPDGVTVMRVILPVEYDAAADLLRDLIDRCEPDVVVGFGQGRSIVDVETIAYNRKDSAGVAGGVPDNRGVVYGGDPIEEGGPATRSTALPTDAILAELQARGIPAGPSTDPGRYVCNNLFYTIMGAVTDGAAATGGFVHLPRIPSVTDADREVLRQTVATVVDKSVANLGR